MSQDPKTPHPPDQAVVDACRLLLEAAEAGRLRSVHIAANYGDGFHRMTTVGDWKDPIVMLGAVTLLARHASDLAIRCANEAEAEAANQDRW